MILRYPDSFGQNCEVERFNQFRARAHPIQLGARRGERNTRWRMAYRRCQ